MKMGVKYQLWKNKQISNHQLVVLSKNPDGSLNTTFELDTIDPKRIHNYQEDYLNEYYDYVGPYVWNNVG
jgi:hypothetical protein